MLTLESLKFLRDLVGDVVMDPEDPEMRETMIKLVAARRELNAVITRMETILGEREEISHV